ncbi:universal stress protein [Phytomonospora sp. NPDC050363]|uniref:universal stress protein n=1 Tax=Phytomonospora sp. NPDC050363 TaxID=3155642 RepID=UPI0033C608AA
MTDSLPITVGVDGSKPSLTAVEHAVEMATRLGAPLRLVHAYESPLYDYPLYPYTGDSMEEYLREHAKETLQELVDRLRADNPALDIRGEQVNGVAAEAIIERSGRSRMTVLGSRGHGGFVGLLLGSVSTQVGTYGHGPIVVVRDIDGERPEDAPVLVGYDGSAGAEAALLFAADEALSRGVVLEVLSFHGPALDDERAHAQAAVASAERKLMRNHPELKVDARAVPGMDPAFRLITHSRTASLTVVGSRGRGGFTGMVLGSVGRTLLHHAFGPVAVVHPPAEVG